MNIFNVKAYIKVGGSKMKIKIESLIIDKDNSIAKKTSDYIEITLT